MKDNKKFKKENFDVREDEEPKLPKKKRTKFTFIEKDEYEDLEEKFNKK